VLYKIQRSFIYRLKNLFEIKETKELVGMKSETQHILRCPGRVSQEGKFKFGYQRLCMQKESVLLNYQNGRLLLCSLVLAHILVFHLCKLHVLCSTAARYGTLQWIHRVIAWLQLHPPN
jgi:hypothetical protein